MDFLSKCFCLVNGGMGIAISDWALARSVCLSSRFSMGIVSGTAIHTVFVRRLERGDPGGHMRRAVEAFPFQDVAQRVYARYFIPGGKEAHEKFSGLEMLSVSPSQELIELIIIANFVEIFLAKGGHNRFVGVNYLEKVQMAHLYSLYGAMLAEVDFVTVGAGMPIQFPAIMEKLARNEVVEYRLDVANASAGEFVMHFDPSIIFPSAGKFMLRVPGFFPIISSTVLAKRIAKELGGKISALVIEGPTAGGHNAPPRDKTARNQRREPVYGLKDQVDLSAIRHLGIPMILAGSYANSARILEAVRAGVAGIQVGSIFALCLESGLEPNLKEAVLQLAYKGRLDVFTSDISPTGYPFKVGRIPGTLSDGDVYKRRQRICDLGFLRKPFKKDSGEIGYRCPSEPIEAYCKKGGRVEETSDKVCLCNCLMSNTGLAQIRAGGYAEPPLVTIGNDLDFVKEILSGKSWSHKGYTAAEAVDFMRKLICRQ